RFNIASPLKREQRSGITIVEIHNAPDIVKCLAEKNIIVSARGKGLRVSVHIFNNFDDIDRLIVGLRELTSMSRGDNVWRASWACLKKARNRKFCSGPVSPQCCLDDFFGEGR